MSFNFDIPNMLPVGAPAAPTTYGNYNRYWTKKPTPSLYKYDPSFQPQFRSYTPQVTPTTPGLFDKPGENLFSGLREPTLDLTTDSMIDTDYGSVSWLTRIENKFCKISLSESVRRTLSLNAINLVILIVLVFSVTLFIVPYSDDESYNWMWGSIVGVVSYLLFSTLIRCILNI